MTRWMLVYPLIIIALTGLAIFLQINTATLSLPISGFTTVLITLLPLLAALNAAFFPTLIRKFHLSPSLTKQLTPAALQLLQLLITAILATNLTTTAIPSALRSCLLESRWASLFSAHDADTIRRIQDAFACCGFNSVHDRAWPFRHGSPGTPQAECTVLTGRTVACRGPWEAALERDAGLELGVVVLVGLMQAVGVILYRALGARRQGSAGAGQSQGGGGLIGGWSRLGMFRTRRRGEQPLLGDGRVDGGERYRDEETGGDASGGGRGPEQGDGRKQTGTNGAGEARYHVEPEGHSHDDPWAGAGRSGE